jgi:hypothetical protein
VLKTSRSTSRPKRATSTAWPAFPRGADGFGFGVSYENNHLTLTSLEISLLTPNADPRSGRFRRGGRESNFLAAKQGEIITALGMKGTPEEFTAVVMDLRMIDGYDTQ